MFSGQFKLEVQARINAFVEECRQFESGKFRANRLFDDLLTYIIHGYTMGGEPLGRENWPYTPEQNKWFMCRYLDILQLIVDAKKKGEFIDALGSIYMQLQNGPHLGQFFTPADIAWMLTKMTVTEKGQTSIADPCCGSGVMLLAAAFDNPNITAFGNDLDDTCVKLCTCNLLLNEIQGVVTHGNSLTNEYYGGYAIRCIEAEPENLYYIQKLSKEDATMVWCKNSDAILKTANATPQPQSESRD